MRRLSILLLLFLVSCVQTVKVQTPFDPAEVAFSQKPGTATVSGQAFMRRNDGLVVYGAGSPVFLVPESRMLREAVTKFEASNGMVKFEAADARMKAYIRQTQANGEGRFSFSNIPDGNYLVFTTVTWKAGDWSQGGEIYRYVTVAAGKNVDVILTR